MNALAAADILRPSAIVVGDRAGSKAEAIDRVGGLLVAEGLVTDAYVLSAPKRLVSELDSASTSAPTRTAKALK